MPRAEYIIASFEVLVAGASLQLALERRYRPDQPRAPRGTPIGGRWVEEDAARTALRQSLAQAVSGDAQTELVADLADDLVALGGGTPRVGKTAKGAPQFIFPNGWVLRFDLAPGQYLAGQKPHINLEHPGQRLNFHIELR